MFYFYFVAGRSKDTEKPAVTAPRRDVLQSRQPGMFIRIDFGKHVDGTSNKPISVGYSSNNVHRAAFRTDATRQPDGKQPNLAHHFTPGPRATSSQTAAAPSRRRHPQTDRPARRSISAGPPGQCGSAVGSRASEPSAYTSTTAEHQNYRTRLSQAHFVSPSNVTATYPPPTATDPPRRAALRPSLAPFHIARKPLPASPSNFRLGENDLPWQTSMDFPSWIAEDYEEPQVHFSNSPTSLYANPSPLLSPLSRAASSQLQSLSCQSEPTSPVVNLVDDPRRTRELVSLSQAMMTVDSFNDDWQQSTNEVESEEGQCISPRRSKSIGWAVRVEPQHLMSESWIGEEPSAQASPLPQCYQGTWAGQHVEYQAQELRRTRSSH